MALEHACGSLLYPRDDDPGLVRYRELLAGVDAVSFDVFDTLVDRLVAEPADIFRLAGLSGDGDPESFRQMRIAAETAARAAAGGREVTLDAIYAVLSAGCGDAVAGAWKEAELGWEMRCCRSRAIGRQMMEMAQVAGKRILLVSDMYLSAAVIGDMLRRCGYDGWERLYLSCEADASKHDGALYRKLLSGTGLVPERILHVGDNPQSDGIQAERHGLASLLVAPGRETCPQVRSLLAHDAPETLSVRLALGLIANEHGRQARHFASSAPCLASPYFLGFATLGPVLLGFAGWLARAAREKKYDKLFFLSRDGFYLQAAYETVARKLGDLPPAGYLAASRALCTYAAIDSVDKAYDVAGVDHYPMPVGAFLANRFRLECDDEVSAALRHAGYRDERDPVVPGDARKKKLVGMLASRIIKDAARMADRYRRYLEKRAGGAASVALVDIGYSGTSQKAIARLTGKKVDAYYLITNVRAAGIFRQGLAYESWAGADVGLEHPFFRHVQLWELFLSATHGSIVDIGEDLSPVSDELVPDGYTRGVLALLRRGALDFVERFVAVYGDILPRLDFRFGESTRLLADFFAHPDPADCRAFSRIIFEDRFGGEERPLVGSGGMDGGIWREAAGCRTMAGGPTPFWPGFGVARTEMPADVFCDERLQPASRTGAFEAMFGDDGFPSATRLPLPVQIVFVSDAGPGKAAATLAGQWALSGDDGIAVAGFEPGARDGLATIRIPGSAEWVLLTDGETLLAPSALAEFAAAAAGADLVYADEDALGADGGRMNPHFKPEFSRQLLLATDYFGGAWLVRRALLDAVVTGCGDPRVILWELALGVALRPGCRIRRVPRILSHRPAPPAGRWPGLRREALAMAARVFANLGAECRVTVPDWADGAGRLAVAPLFPDDGPAVAVIIPTKNHHEIVERCIDSLLRTTYRNFHVYLVDNMSDDPESCRCFAALEGERVTVLRIANGDGGFSYSYVNNRAVEMTQGEEYLLFLNNDTEVIAPRWLSQMVGWQGLPGVGSVGALLYFPSDQVQHAGITHKLLWNILPAPSFKMLARGDLGYQDYIGLSRDSAAQTAACLLTPRSVFLANGMFDEIDFNIAYNDCDYGFKLARQGLWNVYCPDAVLYHYEGLTRGGGRGNDKPGEEAAFVQKYAAWNDPFYSPNLALGRTDFAVQPASPATVPVPRLRVAFVTHNLNYEGAPLVLLDIVRGLAASGRVEPVIVSMEEGALRDVFERLGCRVEVVEAAILLYDAGEDGRDALNRAVRILFGRRIDVVFANTVLAWWAVEAAAVCGLPSIWLIHESEPPFTHLAAHNRACAERGRIALGHAYRTVFVSAATRDVFGHLDAWHSFEVVYNGFDIAECERKIAGKDRREIRQRLGIADGSLCVLLPGTVCERKSQHDLAIALGAIDPSLAGGMSIIILGDRPSEYSDRLHDLVGGLAPEWRDAVRILPYCTNAEEYFLAADVLVSTSRIEAFPKIIQEAMYFGLTIVAAPVFGIAEQVQDEVSALCFPPGDAAKLSVQLTRVVRDATLRRRLADNARISLRRFPLVGDMVREYSRMIGEAWLSGR